MWGRQHHTLCLQHASVIFQQSGTHPKYGGFIYFFCGVGVSSNYFTETERHEGNYCGILRDKAGVISHLSSQQIS